MTVREILIMLEKKYPITSAESWDNPGLLVGDDTREVTKIFLALDVTEEIVDEAIKVGADMVISHHPMIFSGIKQVNACHFTGRKILKLAEHKIACYAMHTNFDVCGMAQINGALLDLQEQKVLYVTEEIDGQQQGIGRAGKLPHEMSLGECAAFVKKTYALPQVKIFGNLEQKIERAAVSGGSGKSMVQAAIDAGAQVLITGDIDHHTGLDALDQSLAIIDAGHYGTEYFFMEQIEKDIEEMKIPVTVVSAIKKFPYQYL